MFKKILNALSRLLKRYAPSGWSQQHEAALEQQSHAEARNAPPANGRRPASNIRRPDAPLTTDKGSPTHELPAKQPGSLRVGILTLPLNANFGGNLQAYALMEVLRQLGHQPVLINRRRPPKGFKDDSADSPSAAETPLISKTIAVGNLANRAFIEKHMAPLTTEFNSTAQLRRAIDRYQFDAVIVGSDQVWRPKYARPNLLDFFLGFLPKDSPTKRIAYAASFGTHDWEFDPKQTAAATLLTRHFDAISVREDSGAALCREHLGADAKHVLDPTLLLTVEHYVRLASVKQDSWSHKDRLLVYILDRDDDKTTVVEALSTMLSITAYSTSGDLIDPLNSPDGIKGDKSVEAWLLAFHRASFVVTDSFHGTVFSILFNKPFIAYGNPSRGMARFISLVKMFGLEDRLIVTPSGIDYEKMLRPIDWTAVNERLAKLRAESTAFLSSALSSSAPTGGAPAPSAGSKDGVVVANSSAAHPLKVLCSGCGVCVSESRGALAMAWNQDGFLMPVAKLSDIPAETVKVCPFNPRPEKEVEDEDALAKIFLPATSRFHPKAGRFENTYAGYSRKFRLTSSSGGMATYIFEKLLEHRHVDYLFIVQSDGGNGYKYRIFDRHEDISKISKTRYFPVSLDELFSVIERTGGRVAVSGVACFIKAIRLKQHYHPELREKIPFLVGIICGGLKSRQYSDFLAESAGIVGPYTHPEYRVKDSKSSASDYSFRATDDKDRLHEVKMRSVGDMWGTGLFKARACEFCTDVLTELADISLGDAWLPEYKADGLGNSIVVTRTALADALIRAGTEAGELVVDKIPIAQVLLSQRGGFNHRHGGMKFRAWTAKYFDNLPLPSIRARLLSSISVPEAQVQILRERTRSKSLRYWQEAVDVQVFKKKMRPSLKSLRSATEARQSSQGDPDGQLTELLATQQRDGTRRSPDGHLGTKHQVVTRWLRRMLRDQRFNFNLLRAALLEAAIIRVQKTSSQNAGDSEPR